MKRRLCFTIAFLFVVIFKISALDLKRTFYEGQLYSGDFLSVENDNSITVFINRFGFKQIEIKNRYDMYTKWYLLDGNVDYALMSFSLFEDNYINPNYGSYKDYQDFLREQVHRLDECTLAYAKNFKASSTLKDNTYTYDVNNIFVPCKGEYKVLWFQNLPWAEGKEDEGIGEYIEFEIMSANELIDRLGDWIIEGDITISILNGFVNPMKQKLFYENNRLKKAAVWTDDKKSFEINFNDYVEFTEFSVPKKTKKVRIEILDVYKGTKYNDTCITKIDVSYNYILDPDSEFNKGL